uniref:WW domain-containing protein n=1 Tax=Alexandrium monilatum TaxID=311494 RepID=A0A7S4SN34_9DINO
MAAGLGRALFGGSPLLRRCAASGGRAWASAPAAALAANASAAASDFVTSRDDLDHLMKVRLKSSLEDRLHRVRHRTWDERQSLRRSEGFQKVRDTRLQQVIPEEQRKILKALRQSTLVLDWQGALSVLPSIPDNPGPEWLPVYRSILNVCCKALRLDEAKQLFWEKLPQRDIMSYNMMLGLFGRLRLEAEAETLLKQMDADRVEKNGVTYVAMLQMCQETSHWEAAIASLNELKGKPELDASTSWPSAYLAAMSACGRSGKKAETRMLFEELRARGEGYVDGNHWNTLIVACYSDSVAARRVFDEMQSSGFTPRISDWKALLGTHRNVAEQQQVYAEAVAALPEGTPLDEFWAVLLRTAVGAGDTDGVRWAMERMREKGADPESESATPSLRRALSWAKKFFARVRRQEAEQREAARSAQWPLPAEALPPVEAPLPAGWSSAVDPTSGHRYFWQDADPAGTTTWTRPPAPATQRPQVAAVAGASASVPSAAPAA